VLPTVPDFCYGHSYPLHRVLQYVYSGTQQRTNGVNTNGVTAIVMFFDRRYIWAFPSNNRTFAVTPLVLTPLVCNQGMEKIMCSVDSHQAVEADRGALGLIPGQDRLNNQCWFTTIDEYGAPQHEGDPSSPGGLAFASTLGKERGGWSTVRRPTADGGDSGGIVRRSSVCPHRCVLASQMF